MEQNKAFKNRYDLLLQTTDLGPVLQSSKIYGYRANVRFNSEFLVNNSPCQPAPQQVKFKILRQKLNFHYGSDYVAYTVIKDSTSSTWTSS